MELPRRWVRIDAKGDNYSGRTGHSCTIANNGFFLFGGADSETRTNDIYFFHARNRQWTKIKIEGDIPSARSGSQSVVYDNKIYFFGGYTKKGGVYFNDMFSFDIINAKWDFYSVADCPNERTDHSVIMYGNCMYVYGGRDEIKIFSDLNKFDFTKMQWTQLENNIEEPKMRFGHTAVQWKHYMYIFGGWDGYTTLNDLY